MWLFVDLNSYFASVEQQLNPNLRGKPVGVVPLKAETTCCIAASYEAKAFGVKTGTKVADARKMCPGMIFVEARHKAYVDFHNKIVESVESCIPISSVMSIDEMACELMGRENEISKAIEISKNIKQKIFKNVGSEMRCSIGIAPNRFLAKVASDMQKPDGLTIIQQNELPHRLYPLKLRDFPGIGRRMEDRLTKHNIKTTEQLCNLDVHHLREVWGGINGERFYHWLRGTQLEIVTAGNKSLSHSHVLPPYLRNSQGSYAVGLKLLQKAGARLRKMGFWASSIGLSIRYTDQTKWSMDLKMLECQDTMTLNEAFKKLWEKRKPGNPLKLTVNIFNLIAEQDRTFSMFEDTKRNDLSKAVDRINAKYGKNMIYFAATVPAKMAAPTRIAFSSIPDFSLED